MNGKEILGAAIPAGAAFLVALAACSPPSSLLTMSQATPQAGASAKPAVAATAVPVAVKTTKPSPAAGSTSSGSTTVSIDELREKGKQIFEKTAGGVGCASCHGPAGSGASAPYVRGATEAQVRNALGGVPAMKFITLNDDEVAAVVAHLEWLVGQPSEHDEHHH